MPMALLLNPSSTVGPWGNRSSSKARKENRMARRKRTPRRGRGGRFVKGGHRRTRRSRRARLSRRKMFVIPRRRRSRRKSRRHNPANPVRRFKGYRRVRRHVFSRSRRHNPFAIMGRKGSFGLVPDLNTIKDAAVKGLGAVVSDVVRSTGYSLIGRTPNQSIAEDFVARLVSGWLTGTAAGYVLGSKMANDVYEGNMVVAVYELAADAAAAATNGQPKLFGFVANPYAGRAVKSFLPSFAFGSSASALPASNSMHGLGGVVPEGAIVPIGGVIPEGDVLPLGGNQRFASRF